MVEQLTYPTEVPEAFLRLKIQKYERVTLQRPNSGSGTEAEIRLPLPSDIQDTHNILESTESLGLLQSFVDQIASGNIGGMEVIARINAALQSAGGRAAVVGGVLSQYLGLQTVRDNIAAEFGIIKNPQLATLFAGVGIKNHTLKWKFAPRSEQESNTIHAIYYTLKKFMHPAVAFNGFALDYPSMVTGRYFQKSTSGGQSEMRNMPKIREAFITTIDMDYLGSNTPAFLPNMDPASLQMIIKLTELNILTRNEIEGSPPSGGTSSRLLGQGADIIRQQFGLSE